MKRLDQLSLAGAAEEISDDDITSRKVLPRPCFEVKSMNPIVKPGCITSIPMVELMGIPPINVYCDMTTSTVINPL